MSAARTSYVTAENLQESARLLDLWRNREVRLSQRAFGQAYGIGTQTAVNQWLHGGIPISLKAAMGFAAGLHCQIKDFSPRLAKLIAEAGAMSGPPVDDVVTWGAPSVAPVLHDLPAHIEFVTSLQHKSGPFAEFLNRPEIRLMIGLLPPADPHDVMLSLIKSAFDSGFDQGANSIAIQMLANGKPNIFTK